MEIAKVVSTRSTCVRRAVGCVLINDLDQIVATGYNGRQRGAPNCIDRPANHCPGWNSVSGERLDSCEAIHAEQNALMQCADVNAIRGCYVTTEPCVHCVKMLLNTSCLFIVYVEPYAAGGATLWARSPTFDRHGVQARRAAYRMNSDLSMITEYQAPSVA